MTSGGMHMGYTLTKNVLKSGDTIYYINHSSRVPGTKNKHRQTMIEKFSASSLKSGGLDP